MSFKTNVFVLLFFAMKQYILLCSSCPVYLRLTFNILIFFKKEQKQNSDTTK